jgi:hypothetical protein
VASGWTLLVAPQTDLQGYDRPDGQPSMTVSHAAFGQSVRLPVIDQVAGNPPWLEVELPQRPNGSTAWIREDAGLQFASTPYRIIVSLSRRQLTLYDQGTVRGQFPVGIGTSHYPTPVGNFFVLFFEKPPDGDPGYGPFVLVTSGHSDTITDWMQSADAVIAIHGPLGAQIGPNGAYGP